MSIYRNCTGAPAHGVRLLHGDIHAISDMIIRTHTTETRRTVYDRKRATSVIVGRPMFHTPPRVYWTRSAGGASDLHERPTVASRRHVHADVEMCLWQSVHVCARTLCTNSQFIRVVRHMRPKQVSVDVEHDNAQCTRVWLSVMRPTRHSSRIGC
jgi:hypothetical protein